MNELLSSELIRWRGHDAPLLILCLHFGEVRAVLETFEDAARLLVGQLAMGVGHLQSLTMTPAIVEKVGQIQTIPLRAIAPEKIQTAVLEFQIMIALV